mmetsp:Transcript_11249/g.18591  ORF Transcript_11249/g.18591 Transcript_11249/m.18591 type:complete len:386 (-) Transcript_11249:74-1231(-)
MNDTATMVAAVRDPLAILSRKDCKVQSLTVSDQHATLLLTHTDEAPDDVDEISGAADDPTTTTKTTQSLLKLTIVPFHKQLLGSNPVLSQEDINKGHVAERNCLRHDPSASAKILSFLKQYTFQLSSDSGEEYSYYTASLEHAKRDPKENEEMISDAGSFSVELISPAAPNQISRAMPSLGHVLIEETPQMYLQCTKPYIQTVVDSGSISWIKNLVEVKKEKERLLVNHDDFIINIDTKWRSHPPPLTTPREEWMNHPSTVDLYCLGICKQSGITCLRDLTSEHIPLLKAMMKEGLAAIKSTYGVDQDQIRVFIHYQPQFYHFHIHFTRLENEVGCSVERGHLVSDVIQNLFLEDYYKNRTITYKLQKGTALEAIIGAYLEEHSE